MEVNDILSKFERIRGLNAQRDNDWRKLWEYYQGNFWKDPLQGGVRLTYNLVNSIVRRFMDYLSNIPDIHCPSISGNPDDLATADIREKILYSIWWLNNMELRYPLLLFYQSLFGLAVCRQVPRPNKDVIVEIGIIDPRKCYFSIDPVYNNEIQEAYIYYDSSNFDMQSLENPKNVLEYWDKEIFALIVEGKLDEKRSFKHNLGFVPFVTIPNNPKPGYVEGESDVAQVVGLVDYLNSLMSMIASNLELTGNPPLILQGTRLEAKDIDNGPGVVIPLEREGKAYYLNPPQVSSDMYNLTSAITRAIEDVANLSEVAFGRRLPAGVSGQSIRTILSSVQARLNTKQLYLGAGLSKVNEQILRIIYEKFSDKELKLVGYKKSQAFNLPIKGKDVAGFFKNQILFQPTLLDYPTTIATELQKYNAGLQSKLTTMENIKIISPVDELARMDRERQERQMSRVPAPGQMPMPPYGQTAPIGVPGAMSDEEVIKKLEEALKGHGGEGEEGQESGMVTPTGSRQEEETKPAAESNIIRLSELTRALRNIKSIRGKAYAIGGIVTEGYTRHDVDIAITNPLDKATILNHLRKYYPQSIGKIHFVPIKEDKPPAGPESLLIVGGVKSGSTVEAK